MCSLPALSGLRWGRELLMRRDFHSHEMHSLSPSTEVFDEGAQGVGTAFPA